ncbi:MAG: DUF5611 family protein [Thermoplasmata archaeon]
MQSYPVRASHRKNLEAATLGTILGAHFESVVVNGESAEAKWGAIELLSVRRDGRELRVELTMNPKVPVDVAAETIARYNRFLEAATGYSSKERAKRLRKSATSAAPGA